MLVEGMTDPRQRSPRLKTVDLMCLRRVLLPRVDLLLMWVDSLICLRREINLRLGRINLLLRVGLLRVRLLRVGLRQRIGRPGPHLAHGLCPSHGLVTNQKYGYLSPELSYHPSGNLVCRLVNRLLISLLRLLGLISLLRLLGLISLLRLLVRRLIHCVPS